MSMPYTQEFQRWRRKKRMERAMNGFFRQTVRAISRIEACGPSQVSSPFRSGRPDSEYRCQGNPGKSRGPQFEQAKLLCNRRALPE